MKKVIVLAIIFAFGTTFAQESSKKVVKKVAAKTAKTVDTAKKFATTKPLMAATPTVDGPGMLFETETIDYGTIEQNADGKREFVLLNNGNKPLIITNAVGSCGCTVPSIPKDPIAPGAKAVIGVKYDTNRPGVISKSITITSNAVGQESKVVMIKGNILPAPTPAAPAVVAPKS